jgi:N-dimethylarginine dimethylaminohydrolase
LSSANKDDDNGESINTDISSTNKNFANQSVVARVYVQPPNFDVLYEKNSKEMAIIKDAEIPSTYNNTLIKLKSEDLSQIKKVIVNLGIDEIIIYHKDAEIAKNLIDSGFNVVIK